MIGSSQASSFVKALLTDRGYHDARPTLVHRDPPGVRTWAGSSNSTEARPRCPSVSVSASVAERSNRSLPESDAFAAGRISGGLLAHRSVHHDETGLGVDVNRLAAHAEEGEHPALAREDPRLVSVAEERRRDAGPQMRLARALGRGVRDPCGGNELTPAPVSLMREQQAESRVVAQDGVEAAECRLLARPVDEPCGVGLRAHRLPDLLFQVCGDGAPDRAS